MSEKEVAVLAEQVRQMRVDVADVKAKLEKLPCVEHEIGLREIRAGSENRARLEVALIAAIGGIFVALVQVGAKAVGLW